MRILRFMSTALTLVLLGLPGAVATASSAAAAEPVSTTVSIQLSRSSMRYAETFTVRGQAVATLPDGTKGWVDNASVTLQRRLSGRSWRTIAQTTTSDTDGEYRFTSVRAQQNAGYRATYAGETRTYPDVPATPTPRQATVQVSPLWSRLSSSWLVSSWPVRAVVIWPRAWSS